jgi:hypothetical protein
MDIFKSVQKIGKGRIRVRVIDYGVPRESGECVLESSNVGVR